MLNLNQLQHLDRVLTQQQLCLCPERCTFPAGYLHPNVAHMSLRDLREAAKCDTNSVARLMCVGVSGVS